jgi:hypothetical protein
MVKFESTTELFETALSDLHEGAERVGFFLADFDLSNRAFHLTDWRVVPPEGFEYRGPYHVSLTDEAQAEAIQWAWQSHSCLVEAHSHDGRWPACFSPSDFAGFDDWVPHALWRLRGFPYAAVVVAGDTLDALAWIDGQDRPEPVAEILLVDGSSIATTGDSWNQLHRQGDTGD